MPSDAHFTLRSAGTERMKERRNKERKLKKFWGGRDSDKLLLMLGLPESI